MMEVMTYCTNDIVKYINHCETTNDRLCLQFPGCYSFTCAQSYITFAIKLMQSHNTQPTLLDAISLCAYLQAAVKITGGGSTCSL